MTVEHNPKAAFLENEEASKNFRTLIGMPSAQIAITHAIAEFALRHNPTTEELAGARKFLSVLLNIGEIQQPMADFPVRRLSSPSAERQPPKPQSPQPPK